MNGTIPRYNLLDAMEAVEEQYMFTAPGHQSVSNRYTATSITQQSQTTPSFPELMDRCLARTDSQPFSWESRPLDPNKFMWCYRYQGFCHLANICPTANNRGQLSIGRDCGLNIRRGSGSSTSGHIASTWASQSRGRGYVTRRQDHSSDRGGQFPPHCQ
jgi:hypothetical protein